MIDVDEKVLEEWKEILRDTYGKEQFYKIVADRAKRLKEVEEFLTGVEGFTDKEIFREAMWDVLIEDMDYSPAKQLEEIALYECALDLIFL